MNINTELTIRRQEVIDLRKQIDKLVKENIILKKKLNEKNKGKYYTILTLKRGAGKEFYNKEGDKNGNRNI